MVTIILLVYSINQMSEISVKSSLFLVFLTLSSSVIGIELPRSIASFSLKARHASDSMNTARVNKIEYYDTNVSDLRKCQVSIMWCGSSSVIISAKEMCALARKSHLKTLEMGGYGTEGFGYGYPTSWTNNDADKMTSEIRIGLEHVGGRLISFDTTVEKRKNKLEISKLEARFFKSVSNKKGNSGFSKHYSKEKFNRPLSFFDMGITCKE